jgi:hypothetical protein
MGLPRARWLCGVRIFAWGRVSPSLPSLPSPPSAANSFFAFHQSRTTNHQAFLATRHRHSPLSSNAVTLFKYYWHDIRTWYDPTVQRRWERCLYSHAAFFCPTFQLPSSSFLPSLRASAPRTTPYNARTIQLFRPSPLSSITYTSSYKNTPGGGGYLSSQHPPAKCPTLVF